MKRLIVILFAVCLPLFAVGFSQAAYAQVTDPFDTVCDGVPTTGDEASTVCAERNETGNPLTGRDGLLVKAARLLTYITGLASVITVIIGGIKYITANGDTNSVNSAKNTILYAIIGVVVSLLAQGIIVLVINKI